MDQENGIPAPDDPAAAAFEALRREVTLLHAAVSGLTADRAAAPDYSETLGEIAQGIGLAVARVDELAVSPALGLSPAQMAREISQAGEAARLQDRTALHQAQEAFARATRDLEGWVDSARLADLQTLRLLQTAMAGLVVGAVLGASLPALIARAAPQSWAWPEKQAAALLDRDMASAGARLLSVADPQGWRALQSARAFAAEHEAALTRCTRAAAKAKKPIRCVILLKPADQVG